MTGDFLEVWIRFVLIIRFVEMLGVAILLGYKAPLSKAEKIILKFKI